MYRLRLDEGIRVVINRFVNALTRALLMAVLVALPSLAVPAQSADTAQIALFTCILAALFTFVEYFAKYPSIIEFRDAAPFNRMRYVMAALIIGAMTAMSAQQMVTSPVLNTIGSIASLFGAIFDQPLSPVRLVLISMPNGAPLDLLFSVRDGAALSYAISLVGVAAFFVIVRIYDWPARNGAFNVWVNLPLFDPTSGGDVVERLRRDGYVHLVLGALLPFFLPALAAIASGWLDLAKLFTGQTYVWSLVTWSFLPASMMMRGIAMCRIAELIEAKRQRTYAQAAEDHLG